MFGPLLISKNKSITDSIFRKCHRWLHKTRDGWTGWWFPKWFWTQITSFLLISLAVSELCPRQNSKCKIFKIKQGQLNWRWGQNYRLFTLHFYSIWSIYFLSFLSMTFVVSELCQSVKMKKGNNSKIRQGRVTVLMHCTYTEWDLLTFLIIPIHCNTYPQ
jgi:hypothetical protein